MAETEETTPLTRKPEKRCLPCSSTMLALIVIIIILIVIAIVVPVALVMSRNKTSSTTNSTDPETEEEGLANNVRVKNIMTHLKALQNIGDENENSDTPSRSVMDQYNASANYVQEKLEAAGYKTWTQSFVVPVFDILGPATFKMIEEEENESEYIEGFDFAVMAYSGNGTVLGEEVFRLRRVEGGEGEDDEEEEQPATGCVAEDFEDMKEDSVALLPITQDCSVYDKARLAEDNGATAIIFYYEGDEYEQMGPTRSRVRGNELNETVAIPVISLSWALSRQFQQEEQKGQFMIQTFTSVTMAYTYNLFAETPYGRDDRLIVFGSHLDSVQDGVGMNDNGSGSSTNLEIALQVARLKMKPVNKVRFAWWGAEELGLLGSKYYTSSLTDEEKANHSLNLNFDMLGSLNYIRGVYNGSGFTDSTNQMRYACGQIQNVFEDGFAHNNLSYSIIPFRGRSDYGSFIEPGIDIPAGALSTGADALKTVEERSIYGGLANAALDTCYHQECDTIDNIDKTVLDQMADVAAYALETLMFKEDLKAFLYNQKSKVQERSVNSRKRRAIRRNPIHLITS